MYTRVVLIGFMGAGKSTVGRLLAPLLGWHFLDIDALLTERLGASIADLFTLYGEPGFRVQEAALIAESLRLQHTVIALGGGAIEHVVTRELLRKDSTTFVVYLQAPLAVSIARCAEEPGAAIRPVLQDPTSLERRFHHRLPLYQTAQLTIATEGELPQSIAHTIAAAIRAEK